MKKLIRSNFLSKSLAFLLTLVLMAGIVGINFTAEARTTFLLSSGIYEHGDTWDPINGVNFQISINGTREFTGTTFGGGGYVWNRHTVPQGSRITIVVTPPAGYRITWFRARTNDGILLNLKNPTETTFNVIATDPNAMESFGVMVGVTQIVPEQPIEVLLNGVALEFDVPPMVVDSRTLVPLRAIFEALGAEVSWNASTQTITGTRAGTTIVLPIGSTTPTVNGQAIPIDVPGAVVNGRTLVPLRFVAESFGVNVNWNAENRLITITS